MPTLETERLLIRAFALDELRDVHQLLDVELGEADTGSPPGSLAERQRWLEWTVLGYEQLARQHQPPYGDRAIVLKRSRHLVGACGLVPCLDRFGQIPTLRGRVAASPPHSASVPEVGLYWAISPAHQRLGYATEAARALVAHAFGDLNLDHIIATTQYTNVASVGVMRKLGMRLDRNPDPDPVWLQVVGLLERQP